MLSPLKIMNASRCVDIRQVYDHFDVPITAQDCGARCAAHHQNGIPFCCDICHAVPTATRPEWDYLKHSTDLWHVWRGDECPDDSDDIDKLRAETPGHLLLLACQGVAHCQRQMRALSCRQFPFFPYITDDDRFLGLTYDWRFESVCWVSSNLGAVTLLYRQQFVETYDWLFSLGPDEYESYAAFSEEMRSHFAARQQRIPILHRNGRDYLLSPRSERLRRAQRPFRRFGPYRAYGCIAMHP